MGFSVKARCHEQAPSSTGAELKVPCANQAYTYGSSAHEQTDGWNVGPEGKDKHRQAQTFLS